MDRRWDEGRRWEVKEVNILDFQGKIKYNYGYSLGLRLGLRSHVTTC